MFQFNGLLKLWGPSPVNVAMKIVGAYFSHLKEFKINPATENHTESRLTVKLKAAGD